jgi:hypothetical protein
MLGSLADRMLEIFTPRVTAHAQCRTWEENCYCSGGWQYVHYCTSCPGEAIECSARCWNANEPCHG